ncbi:hypothetical protein H2199_008234 [Coniosporium tulheliwenetii]|uniref:Uncharacterized protein n=1 Tax=Coniosporium tulheliwenetii TaxID=3383036 RepID=A0ACC2YKS4_9PEZI|nr:hypothetical protein H2199_008234 [Cladosporium sp. JES 115]
MDASKIRSHENVLTALEELDAQSDASSATFYEVSSPIKTAPDDLKGRATRPKNDVEKAENGVDAQKDKSDDLFTWPNFIGFISYVVILVGCITKLYVDSKKGRYLCAWEGKFLTFRFDAGPGLLCYLIEKLETAFLRFETRDGFLCWLMIFGVVSSGIKNFVNAVVEVRMDLDDLKYPDNKGIHRGTRLVLSCLQGGVLALSITVCMSLQDFSCTWEKAGAQDGGMGGNSTTVGV